MFQSVCWAVLSWLWILLAPSQAALADESPLDYDGLDFTTELRVLRAGNHDPKGKNEYYFRATLFGVPVLKEEIKKSLKDRKKSEHPLGVFSEVAVPNLKYWKAEKKAAANTALSVSGDTIRELVGQTMTSFSVPEEKTSIVFRIEMFERSKIVPFIGEDLRVGESLFAIIPDTPPHRAVIEPQTLTIRDDLGTHVEFSLEFKKTEKKPNP